MMCAEIWTRTPSFPFHSLSLSLPTNFLLFGFILPNSRREVAVATRFGFGCSVSISRFIAFSVWFVICRSLVRLPLSPPHFSVWPQARWSQLLLVTFLFWQVEILVSSSDALVPSSFLLLLVRHLLLVAWHLLLVAQKSGHERRPFPFTRCPCPFQPTSCSSDSFSRTPEGKLQLLRGFGFGCSVSISRFIAFSVWFVICRSLVRLPLSPPHFSVWPQARWSQLLLVTFLFWQVEILVSSSDALVPSSFLLLLVRHLLLVAWHLLLVAQKSGHERRPFPFTRCPCPFQPTSCSSDSFSRTPEGKLQLLRGSCFGCSVSISRFIAFSVWFVICRSLVRLPLSPPHFSVWPQARWSQLLLVTFLFWQVEILVSSSDALVPSSFLLLLVRHLLLVAWHLLLVAQKSGHERRPFPFTRCPCPFQPTSCSSDSFSRTPEGKLQLLRGSVLDVQCPSRGSLHSLFGSLFVGLLCVCHFHLRIFQSGHKHVGVSFCL